MELEFQVYPRLFLLAMLTSVNLITKAELLDMLQYITCYTDVAYNMIIKYISVYNVVYRC
jgi:hypothetical protein